MKNPSRFLTVWVACAAMFLCSGSLAAEDEKQLVAESNTVSPFKINPVIDGAVIAVASTIWLGGSAFADEVPFTPCDPCDRESINRFDRLTVDADSSGSNTASDVLLLVLPAGALGLSLLNLKTDGGAREFWRDFTLVMQVIALNGMFHRFTAFAVDRPRPYVYQDDPSRLKNDVRDYTSFYSGHTSTAFALATSMSYIFSVRYPHSRWRFVVWVVSMLAAGTTGALRVAAGKHFLTDVFAGAVAGSGIGLLVPALHRNRGQHVPSLAVGPNGMNLSLRF